MSRRGWCALLAGLVCYTAVARAADAPKYPAPAAPLNDAEFGAGIQRTMTLLATSTPQQRHTVRVLFYGQSITGQAWTGQVADYLKKTWPNANLIIENRSIGGFGSPALVKTAEADLYPFCPDLMIFHVYGDAVPYEQIIARARARTSAEVIIQTDHVIKDDQLSEEADPAKLSVGLDLAKLNSGRTAPWNAVFLPQVARRYGAELCDQRSEWKRYLRANSLKVKDLLADSVHLNAHGCYLMAELVKQHLRHRPQQSDAAWRGLTRTLRVGQDVRWQDGRLTLAFEGHRVDAVATSGAAAAVVAPAEVLIDGRKPSTIPGLTIHGRTTPWPKVWFPTIMKIGFDAVPIAEEWSARLFDNSDDMKSFKFEVTGSVTGPDGIGSNKERFVSKSGRVVIDPADWFVTFPRSYSKTPMPANFTVKWKTTQRSVDQLNLTPAKDAAVETTVCLASGLSNGQHQLELVAAAGTVPALAALRVYRPALAGGD